MQDAGILQVVTPADVLAEYAAPITDAIRRDLRDREFPDTCEARGGGRWTLSLAKVPHDLQTDQTMHHLMGDFSRRAARGAGDYKEHLSDEPDSMVFYQLGWRESRTRDTPWLYCTEKCGLMSQNTNEQPQRP